MSKYGFNCPGCGETLNVSARACPCGWKRGSMSKVSNDHDKRCNYHANGSRCEFPGSIVTGSTAPGTPGYCRFHDGSSRADYGMAIIEESKEWLRNINAGRDVAHFLTTEHGQPSPNYTTLMQRDKMHKVTRDKWLDDNGLSKKADESQQDHVDRMRVYCRGKARVMLDNALQG